MTQPVQHDAAHQQFFIIVDGTRCIIDYQLQGARMTITHTVVPDAVAGRGIAGTLTQAALEHARTAGWKVIPACTYAAAYFKRHPQYADLLL
jgi:uncharacterized protein